MSLRNRFKTDPTKEKKGVWVDFEDCRVLIRRAGRANKEFAREVAKHTRELQLQGGGERAVSISRRIFAKTVIVGWETSVKGEWLEGIDPQELGNKAGELLPVTPDNIEAVLKELPEVFDILSQYATDHETFLAGIREENAKNS